MKSTGRSAVTGRYVVLTTPSPTRARSAQEKQAVQRGLKRNEQLRAALGRNK
jgi:hypothetical protein